ncbi:MAG: GNAT family N-acetyltransferase [Pseudobdellovibrionaceae bacterium]
MINRIAEETLPLLKPLLDRSAGYNTCLSDEVDYFKSAKPNNWFYASREGHPVGFIRCFPQGNWGTVELFLYKEENILIKPLLQAFIERSFFDKDFRLRFEIPVSNDSLRELLIDFGFNDRVEKFCYYEIDLAEVPQNFNIADKAQLEDISQVKAAFENLHPVDEQEVSNWIEDGNVYISHLNDEIATAAQVYVYGNCAEIKRIATNIRFLNSGCAYSLLSSIHGTLKSDGIMSVFLTVDENKTPARSLYEKIGYIHNKNKDQVWLSKIY